MKKRTITLAFALIALFAALPRVSSQNARKIQADIKTNTVSSPDGRIKLYFSTSWMGEPFYKVTVDGKPFINESGLGVSYGGSAPTGHSVDRVQYRWEQKELWEQPWGENKRNLSYYNEMKVTLLCGVATYETIYFRVFNDGFAIRYTYDVDNAVQVPVIEDNTSFMFAENGTAWWQPADADTYELEYKTTPLDKVEHANTPMTVKFDSGLYASIHEAALYNFPEMTLMRHPSDSLLFVASLSETVKGVSNIKASVNAYFETPWRTVQIGRKAVDLINSSLILNLNEPSRIEDTSWIRPMKYIGIWWGMHLGINSWTNDGRHGATTSEAKRYIDFAARHKIDAVLVEGWNEGWETWGNTQNFCYTCPYPDFDIKEVSEYAARKGVKIIGHHETGGNIRAYESSMDTAMTWYGKYGIDCIKTGYAGGIPGNFTHHGQYLVNHYQKVVETAAEHKVMLDVHEPVKDTGIRRTWPNMMTREGGRGMEWNAWSSGNAPSHTVILPYTALLAGPMDYNPGIFDILYENTRNMPQRKKWNANDTGDSRVNTTLAKQIANWVILYSPWQMAADLIDNYEGHPAFRFFEEFDPDCDVSRAVAGEIGEYIVIVRKAGDRYFLGASTDETAREIALPLSFLEKGRQYRATIYADGEKADWKTNPTDYRIMEKEVSASDTLQVKMASGGGQAIIFAPVAGK